MTIFKLSTYAFLLSLLSTPGFGFITTHSTGSLVAPCGALPLWGSEGRFGCYSEDALFNSHYGISNPRNTTSYYLAKGGFIQIEKPILSDKEATKVAQLSPALLEIPLSDYLITTISSGIKGDQNYQILICLKQRAVFSCYKKDINPILPSPYITARDLVFKSKENIEHFYVNAPKTDFFYFATLEKLKVLRIYRNFHGNTTEVQYFSDVVHVIPTNKNLNAVTTKEIITFNPDHSSKDSFHQALIGQQITNFPPISGNILAIVPQVSGSNLLYFYSDRAEIWHAPGLLMKKKRVLLTKDFFFTDERLYFKLATIPFNGLSRVYHIDQHLFRDMYVVDRNGIHKLEQTSDAKTYNDGTYQFIYYDTYTSKQISRGSTIPAKEVSFKDIFSIDIERSTADLQKHLYSFDRDLLKILSTPDEQPSLAYLRKYLLVTFIQNLQYPAVKGFVTSSSLQNLKNGFQQESAAGRLTNSSEEQAYLATILTQSFKTALTLYTPAHKDLITAIISKDSLSESDFDILLNLVAEYSQQPYLASRASLQTEVIRLLQNQ